MGDPTGSGCRLHAPGAAGRRHTHFMKRPQKPHIFRRRAAHLECLKKLQEPLMTDRISRALILIFIVIVALVALPAFAVWPMPQYCSYPDCGGTTPAENCSQQPGPIDMHRQTKMGFRRHICVRRTRDSSAASATDRRTRREGAQRGSLRGQASCARPSRWWPVSIELKTSAETSRFSMPRAACGNQRRTGGRT